MVPGVSFTPADTVLGLNQKAVVAFFLNNNPGAVGITVTSVDKGAEADLAGFDLGDRVKGLTPYYVKVTVTNETGSDFSFSSLGLTTPLLADGSEAQGIGVIGTFAPCPNDSAGKDFTTKGASYTTCVVGLAQQGTEVTGLSYSDGTHGEVQGEPDYGIHPVLILGPGTGS